MRKEIAMGERELFFQLTVNIWHLRQEGFYSVVITFRKGSLWKIT